MPISDIVVVEYSLNLHFIYSHRPLAFTNVIVKLLQSFVKEHLC